MRCRRIRTLLDPIDRQLTRLSTSILTLSSRRLDSNEPRLGREHCVALKRASSSILNGLSHLKPSLEVLYGRPAWTAEGLPIDGRSGNGKGSGPSLCSDSPSNPGYTIAVAAENERERAGSHSAQKMKCLAMNSHLRGMKANREVSVRPTRVRPALREILHSGAIR